MSSVKFDIYNQRSITKYNEERSELNECVDILLVLYRRQKHRAGLALVLLNVVGESRPTSVVY
jgi:hypothetical protein